MPLRIICACVRIACVYFILAYIASVSTTALIWAACILFTSLFEWTLHRFIMHRPFLFIRYPYVAHALTHHRIFRADHTYHAQNETAKKKVPMAWWNSVVLVPIGAALTIPVSLYFHNWQILLISFVVFWAYYAAYEYMHWCMHVPRPRRVLERLPIVGFLFYRLDLHHFLHHRRPGKNLNVVLPFADLMFGTLDIPPDGPFSHPRGQSAPTIKLG